MALPVSGEISLDDVQTEFGGTNPIAISEYYGAAVGVPASGEISLSDFHGTSAILSGDIAIFAGGNEGSYVDTMEYVIITTNGNTNDFGNLIVASYACAATSNGSNGRGLVFDVSTTTKVQYVTINTRGNATTFGGLFVNRNKGGATSNGTANRGIYMGGSTTSGGAASNVIDYVTITTTGNAADLADLYAANRYQGVMSNATNNRAVSGGGGGSGVFCYKAISTTANCTAFASSPTRLSDPAYTSNGTGNRGLLAGGYESNFTIHDNIEYITISTASSATTFGDLYTTVKTSSATSNGTSNKGVFGGGEVDWSSTRTNRIEHVTITSLGNASLFGTLSATRNGLSALSNK